MEALIPARLSRELLVGLVSLLLLLAAIDSLRLPGRGIEEPTRDELDWAGRGLTGRLPQRRDGGGRPRGNGISVATDTWDPLGVAVPDSLIENRDPAGITLARMRSARLLMTKKKKNRDS